MCTDYPDDDDGNVLRQVAAHGADMSRPMQIEFTIGVPDVECARSLAEKIFVRGSVPRIYVDAEDNSVSLYCAKNMLATYEGVVAAQSELNEICVPVGPSATVGLPQAIGREIKVTASGRFSVQRLLSVRERLVEFAWAWGQGAKRYGRRRRRLSTEMGLHESIRTARNGRSVDRPGSVHS